jgi:drug/metabolite transporter (DMT)-like permease
MRLLSGQSATVIGGLSALSSVFLWSLSGMIIKMGLSNVEPSCHLLLRLFTASVLIGVYSWYINKKFFTLLLTKLRASNIFLMSSFFLITSINLLAQTYTLKQVPYTWYVILFSFQPLIILLLIESKTKLKNALGGLLIILAGVFLFTKTQGIQLHVGLLNISLIFVCISLWTAYTFLVTKLNHSFLGKEIALLTVVTGMLGAFVMIVCTLWVEPINLSFVFDNHILIGQILLSGFLTAFIYGLYSTGLRFAPSLTVILQYVDPLVGCALAFVFLHESLEPSQMIGGGCILLGIYLTKRCLQTRPMVIS